MYIYAGKVDTSLPCLAQATWAAPLPSKVEMEPIQWLFTFNFLILW